MKSAEDLKSVEEVSRLTDLTRRAIQEYERVGAAQKPAQKTERGYLRYNNQDIFHLMEVRFYRGLGYSQQEIKEILQNPDSDRRAAIEEKLSDLKKKTLELECLTTIAEAVKDGNAEIFTDPFLVEDMPYDLLISSLSAGIQASQDDSVEFCLREPSDEELDQIFELVQAMQELGRSGHSADSPAMQELVEMLYRITSGLFSPSIPVFFWISRIFGPKSEVGIELDRAFGEGCAEILSQAIHVFCSQHRTAPEDQRMLDALSAILSLGQKKHAAGSEPVQAEVAKLHASFREIGILQPPLKVLESLGTFFGTSPIKESLDKDRQHGYAWFLSRAIEIYCNHYKNDTTEEST